MYIENKWNSDRYFNFNYLKYLPKNMDSNKKYPLVLFLHGADERGDDYDLIAVHGPMKYIKQDGKEYPFICIAPQCPNEKYWGCFTESLLAFIDYLCDTLPIDTERIYLTGLSMGGTGTWMLAMADPDRFAAIAPIAGSGIYWYAGMVKDIPILMYHGDCDDIVPIDESVNMMKQISKFGGHAELKICYGVGHNAWDYAYDDKFYEWLLSHRRYSREYKKWLKFADDETKAELEPLLESEIEDRFYRHLEFGTGGLRGVIGAGTNRINAYIIARATKGLADYITENSEDITKESVVIAYDSRNFSDIFAKKAADVLSGNGIKVYLFDELRPTPELSFAIRHLKTTAGIVITASHNPAKYNGYKVYWSDGGQIPPNVAKSILEKINSIDVFAVKEEPNADLIEIIGKDVDDAYIENVYAQSVNPNVSKDNFKLVYTPLHGSGNKLVRRILDKSGFKNVIIVKEQELPDGNFSTVASPNPENKECFDLAISLAKENDADLIIGTDPDSDRMGIVVKNRDGDYVTMTGNQVGIMLLDYILSSNKLPINPAVVTTIVSTKMVDVVCEHYGTKLFRTLTGFKFIGEKIYEFEKSNEYEYMFGFEESYGYLKGTYARDKDAVVASMLTAEMAAYYAERGMTLYDVMQNLYAKFGGYYEELESITFEGVKESQKIKDIMSLFRNNLPEKIGAYKIKKLTDYLGETPLPKSDVLYFELENGVDFVIRPSGTEPKIKIYYLTSGKTYDDAKQKSETVKKAVAEMIMK